jgi:hypothetical protein
VLAAFLAPSLVSRFGFGLSVVAVGVVVVVFSMRVLKKERQE